MKCINKVMIFSIFLFCTFTVVLSQDNPNENAIGLKVDYARFQKNSENSYVEFYYSYSPRSLSKIENGKITQLLIQFIIKNVNTGDLVVDRMWNLRNEILDSTDNNKSLMGLTRFILTMGQYHVSVNALDLNNRNLKDSVQFDIAVPFYKDNYMTLSDIEICSSIKQIERDTTNIFYKNGLEIKPNPLGIVHYSYPLIGYYIECYNLQKSFLGPTLVTSYKIFDGFGREQSSKTFKKPLSKETSIEAGIINLNNFPGGSYTLAFSVLDSNNKAIITKQKKFYMYNPSVAMKPKNVRETEENPYSLMTLEELDRLFNQAKYIAKKSEITEYKVLPTVEAKRNYLNEFWNKRSTENFNSKNYSDRIQFANNRFRTKFQEGWFTDRGRVCAMYGIPEETFIERGNVDEETGYPFEIWYYPLVNNGVYFVFVDESGFSSYRMVHSTHPNEMKDQKWDTFLKSKK